MPGEGMSWVYFERGFQVGLRLGLLIVEGLAVPFRLLWLSAGRRITEWTWGAQGSVQAEWTGERREVSKQNERGERREASKQNERRERRHAPGTA